MAVEENQKMKLIVVEQQLREAYLDYSMSVIVGRALPDVRDGLKPVHRRILFAMHDMGLSHNKSFVKCARIVGECFKYHPHGDAAVYDSLVRMAQDFSLRYPLVSGHGNFGSQDSFGEPAAMRYTEAKLSKIAQELLEDLEKETVQFAPNFDGSMQEPLVLPSKIPNLLLNGSSGIAVGMTTNIPPHNINEICDATILLLENEEGEFNKILECIKGPDFPTGAQIIGTEGIRQAYKTGKGRIIVRAKANIEKDVIIINEIPYQINKSALIEQIADLVKEKTIEGISDIRDESDREGMSIVIELKKAANPELILNQLYKHSQLQTTFGIINLALVNNEPKVLSLKELILEFIKHRKNVIVKRTKYDLRKAEERDHILQGLLTALRQIDDVIALIRASNDVDEAKTGLISNFILTEIQASAILEMKLSRLAALEQQKILDEHNELLKFIQEMKDILASEKRVKAIIKDELIYLKNVYGDKRKTEIIQGEEEVIDNEDLIEEEQVVITATHSGYVKRQSLDVYRAQRRGGKGIIGTEIKDENDFVEHLFIASTHSYILIFTDQGMVHWLKSYQIPESGRYAKGTAIVNLIKLGTNEKIAAMISVDSFEESKFLLMATKNGVIKKTQLSEYGNPRQGGIIAINLRENDKLIGVDITDGTGQIILATKDGRAVRFKEIDLNIVGRNSIGVRGINVRNSEVVGMEIVKSPYILTVTERGYGKRSRVEDYRLINRGGSGVTNVKITEKNGKVVSIKIVDENDEILLISKNGVIIRTSVKSISTVGRNSQGVRVMNLDEGDRIATVATILGENGDLELKKEEYKPSENRADDNGHEAADISETDIHNGNEIIEDETGNENLDEENILEKNEIKKETESIRINENKILTEEEVKEFLKENLEVDNSEEKPSKKDFTLEGYKENY